MTKLQKVEESTQCKGSPPHPCTQPPRFPPRGDHCRHSPQALANSTALSTRPCIWLPWKAKSSLRQR